MNSPFKKQKQYEDMLGHGERQAWNALVAELETDRYLSPFVANQYVVIDGENGNTIAKGKTARDCVIHLFERKVRPALSEPKTRAVRTREVKKMYTNQQCNEIINLVKGVTDKVNKSVSKPVSRPTVSAGEALVRHREAHPQWQPNVVEMKLISEYYGSKGFMLNDQQSNPFVHEVKFEQVQPIFLGNGRYHMPDGHIGQEAEARRIIGNSTPAVIVSETASPQVFNANEGLEVKYEEVSPKPVRKSKKHKTLYANEDGDEVKYTEV